MKKQQVVKTRQQWSVFEVALTDTHLHEKNIEVSMHLYNQAIEIALSHKLTRIVHFGDVFDSRKAQSLPVLKAFLHVLDKFDSEGLTLDVIPGNHDKTWYSSESSFLDPFREHPALNLYSMSMQTPNRQKGVMIDYIPFFADEEYIEQLDSLRQNATDMKRILYTHIGVDEAVMNNGIAVESCIKPNLFKHYDAVYIGHYHDPQSLRGNIHYVGASLQHNFGESPDKGLTVIFDDLTFDTIPLEFPKYIKKEIDVTKVSVKEIEKLKKTHEGDNVRIVLVGKQEDLKSYNKAQLIDLGVQVAVKQEVLEEAEITAKVEPHTSASLSESFKTFCKERKLDHKQGLKYFNQIKF